MKTSVEEQKHYIKNQTEELSNNILTKIQNHIAVIEDNRNEWTKECDGKLEDIEQRINRIEMRELPSVQGGGAMDLCNIKCRVRFVDTQKQNPIEFLKEFERKYKSLSDKIKIEIFEQHLDGRGMAWFQLVVDKIKTFDELKQKFINYFWDDVEQGKAVELLQTDALKQMNTQ
uniref:Retrotransposon gag domain-containing protein n=1 Tax=Rhodnius prolixus TaxID=13249 RepID=T1HJR1_RHOPR